jgi:cell division protein FtsI (penicillin-binding protein 3)
LQLAQAYASLGNNGRLNPVTFVRIDRPDVEMHDGYQVVSSETAADIVEMMKSVVSRDGTGKRAAIAGYQVAGKTGTSWKFTAGGYSTDKYIAVFAGLVPASSPRLATVVVINEPTSGKYYGGEVSAPVFAQISAGALRLMAVAPDMLETDIAGHGPLIQAMSTQ